MRKTLFLLFLLAGCQTQVVTPTPTTVPVTLKAILAVKGETMEDVGKPCEVKDPLLPETRADLTPAIQQQLKLVVKDANGAIVGTAPLGSPTYAKSPRIFRTCSFPISATVPESSAYTLSVGKVEQTFTLAEIKKGEVTLPTTLEDLRGIVK